MFNFKVVTFFFFLCILLNFFLPVGAGNWKMFASVAKSRRSFTAQSSVQVSSLGLVVILSMEKDNNLDYFSTHFFQSADAMNGMAY